MPPYPPGKPAKKQYHLLHNPHPLLRIAFIVCGAALLLLGGIILWIAFTPLPDVNAFIEQQPTNSTKIYDRTGQTLLYDLNSNVRRDQVPLASTSPYIQQATIAIEDSNFYNEGAVSFTAIIRSLYVDVTSGAFVEGGSTLTQQVVKNSLLTQQKSIIRKVQEWILAYKLAQHYSKNQILELYLNSAPYGGDLYGVEAASRAYFGVDADSLDLAQAAYLAAMPQSPTYYSPYGNNRAALDTRKNLVLSRMQQLGYITQTQYDQASTEVVN